MPIAHNLKIFSVTTLGSIKTSYNIYIYIKRSVANDIEIDRIGSITQETEFSEMAELLYTIHSYDIMAHNIQEYDFSRFHGSSVELRLRPTHLFTPLGVDSSLCEKSPYRNISPLLRTNRFSCYLVRPVEEFRVR